MIDSFENNPPFIHCPDPGEDEPDFKGSLGQGIIWGRIIFQIALDRNQDVAGSLCKI